MLSGLEDKIEKARWFSPLIILIITLIIYLSFWAYFSDPSAAYSDKGTKAMSPIHGSDSFEYAFLADSLIFHGVFSESRQAPFFPDTHRTPGYPLILAGFKLIFHSFGYFPLFQILLVALSGILIFKIGQKLYSGLVGLIAAFLYVVDPTTIFHSLIILTDITFVFLLLACVYFLLILAEKKYYWSQTAAGGLLGLATLVRPIGMFLVILFTVFYFLVKKKSLPLKKIIIGLAVFLAGFTILVAPWVVRNKTVSGVWGISSARAYVLYRFNLPEFLAVKERVGIEDIRSRFNSEVGSLKPGGETFLANSAALDKVSFKYLKAEPFSYVKFHLVKTLPFFLSGGTKFFVRYQGQPANMTNLLLRGQWSVFFGELTKRPLLIIEQFGWLMILILSLTALFFRQSRLYSLLFLGLIFYFAFSTGLIAYARYRLPAAPFLFLSASFSFLGLIKYIAQRFRRYRQR